MSVETLKRDIQHAFYEIDEVIDITKFLGKSGGLDSVIEQYFSDLNHVDKINGIIEMKRHDETKPHYEHSLRVGILSWMALKYLGEDFIKNQGLKFGEEEMAEYCIGGILHDCGKLKINKNLLVKHGPLTEEDYKEIKKHRDKGLTVAEDFLKGNDIKTALIKAIIYGHHGYNNDKGNGYDAVLNHERFNGLIQLVALADNVDAPLFRGIYQRKCSPGDLMNYIELVSTSKTKANTGITDQLRAKVDAVKEGNEQYFKRAELGRFDDEFARPYLHMLRAAR